jgi:hypothetical protein
MQRYPVVKNSTRIKPEEQDPKIKINPKPPISQRNTLVPVFEATKCRMDDQQLERIENFFTEEKGRKEEHVVKTVALLYNVPQHPLSVSSSTSTTTARIYHPDSVRFTKIRTMHMAPMEIVPNYDYTAAANHVIQHFQDLIDRHSSNDEDYGTISELRSTGSEFSMSDTDSHTSSSTVRLRNTTENIWIEKNTETRNPMVYDIDTQVLAQ